MKRTSAQTLGRTFDCAILLCDGDADEPGGLCPFCKRGGERVRLLGGDHRQVHPTPTKQRHREPTSSVGKPLTPHQREVLEGAGNGETAEETAARLGTSRTTVLTQRKHARQRLDARNMAHAFALAFRSGQVA